MSRELIAGNRVRPIIPDSAEAVFRMAEAVVQARMAPKGMESPQAVAIAIFHGLEIGLAPMTALQRIAIVNGRPTIYGDAAIGLVRASGLLEWMKEEITGEGDDRCAICKTKRQGDPEPIIGRFSVADAKRAGLWGKAVWASWPDRMLTMRARAFALRDGFADVLGGLYFREELDDSAQPPKPPPPPPRPPEPEPPPPAAKLEPPKPPPPTPAATPSPPPPSAPSPTPPSAPSPPPPPTPAAKLEPPEPPPPPPAPSPSPASPPTPSPPAPEPKKPPSVTKAKPPPRGTFDFKEFRDALRRCETTEEMNSVFEKLTHGIPDGPILDECQAIINELASPLHDWDAAEWKGA